VSRHGAELSGGTWEAEPGQRSSWPVVRPLKRASGGSGVSTPPAGLSVKLKALKIGWMRA
jgi:hypothetical protein